VIYEKNEPIKDKKSALRLLYIDDLTTLTKQITIYNALEESKDMLVILISQSHNCIENLEKRIKSRFSNKKIFFKYFDDKQIIPTLKAYKNNALKKKYKLFMYNILKTMNS
ncbi:hypothetical protein TUBRATIS_27470, partial [Tubulinosema ratisbonensis]